MVWFYFAAETPNGQEDSGKQMVLPREQPLLSMFFRERKLGLSFPEFLTEMNGVLYFNGQDESGSGLWKSDGTPQGTVKIKAMGFDTSSQGPFHFAKMNGHLYFNGFDEDHGSELWEIGWNRGRYSDGKRSCSRFVAWLPANDNYGESDHIFLSHSLKRPVCSIYGKATGQPEERKCYKVLIQRATLIRLN